MCTYRLPRKLKKLFIKKWSKNNRNMEIRYKNLIYFKSRQNNDFIQTVNISAGLKFPRHYYKNLYFIW